MLAHEIAHIAARHGEKLMRPTSSITKMLMQGATMAADEFTSSDLVVPFSDATLAETKALLAEPGGDDR